MAKLAFYSKSRDYPAGSGPQEYIVDITKYNFKELNNIRDWRKILSNFHVYPFKYTDGYTYNSIEHVFQAMKIALVDPEKALLFTVESGDDIGVGDGAIAQKNRKLVKLDKNHLYQWDKIKANVMRTAAECKYAQCEEAQKVLIATGDAELWHIVSRSSPVRFEHLEKIREKIIIHQYDLNILTS
jgi:predicted NAD-dependent protein-ADP-ribosyltransferase YbiA (DUF1768 family)